MVLKHAIVDSGLTQRVIARRARIDETWFSRIVNGKEDPTPRQRKAISRALRCAEGDLFPAETTLTAAGPEAPTTIVDHSLRLER